MTIEIEDGRYFAALWYLENEPTGNWMGAVYRDHDGTWQLVYRFRTYVDDVMDETSKDLKSWQGFSLSPCAAMDATECEAKLVGAVDNMLAKLQGIGYGTQPVQKLEPKSDRADVISDMVTREKFAHAKLSVAPTVSLSTRPAVRGET